MHEPAHRRASGQTVRLEAAGQPTRVTQITAVPTEDTRRVEAPGWTAHDGTAAVSTVVGGAEGFAACGVGQRTHTIGIDLVWPAGPSATDSRGRLAELVTIVRFEGRRADAAGQPLNDGTWLGQALLRDKTRTPQRRCYRFRRPVAGRRMVRARRTDDRPTVETDGHDLALNGLRGAPAAPPRGPRPCGWTG